LWCGDAGGANSCPFGAGEVVESAHEDVVGDPQVFGDLSPGVPPTESVDDLVDVRQEEPCRLLPDPVLHGSWLTANVVVADVDEFVGEGASAFVLQ
jgi:hypothetical protein